MDAPASEEPRRPVTGLVLARWGCLAALLILIVIGAAHWAFVNWLEPGAEARANTVCLSHLIDLYRGARMYAADHGDKLPSALEWCGLIRDPYLARDDAFYCPVSVPDPGYAMNSACDGTALADIDDPGVTLLFYDSAAGQLNVFDALTSLPDPPRHPRGNNGIWMDGHTGAVEEVSEQAPK